MDTQEALAKGRTARRTPRREKMRRYAATFAALRRESPRLALPVIDQAEAGSLPAAVKLLCLSCSGWVRAEVRDCVVTGCPLYPHRPYQQLTHQNPNDPPAR